MTEPRRFDLGELAGADDPAGDAELGRAFAAARTLESALAGPDPRPSPDLADRIMGAVAREPAPRPLGILSALRRRPGIGGLLDSLRVAWGRSVASGRPIGLRAGALAYVAAVVVLAASLTGVAAYATAGAIGLFGPPASHQPASTPGLETPEPLASPEPTELQSAEPTESPEPTESAEPSGDRGGASQEPGDDGGGAAQPGASADSGGDGGSSDSATQTSDPTQTPKATTTPRPSQTPQPTSSD